MTPEELWTRYAKIWSASATERSTELPICLHETARYCDPNGSIDTYTALSAYMGAFQQSLPGARFLIDSVLHHHQRTLASWKLHDSAGRMVHAGTSFALLCEDGRFIDITGFFHGVAEK